MLGRPGVNPAANNNEAIISAQREGHQDILNLLLADGRAVLPTNN